MSAATRRLSPYGLFVALHGMLVAIAVSGSF